MEPFLISAFLLAAAAILVVLTAYKNAESKRVFENRLGGSRLTSQVMIPRSAKVLGRWKWSLDDEVPRLLDRMAWRGSVQRTVYFVCQLGIPLVAILLLLAELMIQGVANIDWMELSLLAGLGYLLPKRYLVSAVKRRQQRISAEVSLMVPVLRMLFEAGMTVEQGIRALVSEGREVIPELSKELDIVTARVDAGLELGEELRAMSALLDVDALTDCVIILEQLISQGGGASASLATLKELLDDRRLTAIQEKVSKLSAKMSAVMVAFLFPALLIVLAGPGFIAIFNALKGVG